MKRRLAWVVLAASLAVGLVATGGATARTDGTTAPTIYFLYAMNCTFTIQDDSGKTVTSIPPGSYQVDVRTPLAFGTLPAPPGTTDMTACRGMPQFQLTGPGVNLFTTMTAGCESDKLFAETFQANATYVAQDLNQPSIARGSFTTLATGSPTNPTVAFGDGKGKGETSQDIVGSRLLRGPVIKAAVGAGGKLTLTTGGKAVSKLKVGHYKLTIDDENAKRGFTLLGPTSTKPLKLTTAAFRGKRTVTVALTTGRWTYYTTVANIRYFRVT